MASRTDIRKRAPILQVMPKEKFTKGFVEFTNDSFPEEDIVFLLYGDDRLIGYVARDAFNVFFFDGVHEMLRDNGAHALIRQSSMIVLNWCDWGLARALCPYGRKLYLMFWGGDIYGLLNPPHDMGPLRKAKHRVRLLANRLALQHARGVITLIPGDLQVVERLSRCHGKWFLGCVAGGTRERAIVEREESLRALASPKPGSPMRALLGNSATPTNRHAEMLDALAHFSGEDIEVYAPLSYGDPGYREEVIARGKGALGEKFRPMIDFVDPGEYREFLSTVSIGVFNQNRQQGMGNIALLMRTGAKVYLATDSPMWDDFGREGRAFFDSSEIRRMTFGEFAAYSCEDARRNFGVLDPVAGYDEAVGRWRAIYAEAGSMA